MSLAQYSKREKEYNRKILNNYNKLTFGYVPDETNALSTKPLISNEVLESTFTIENDKITGFKDDKIENKLREYFNKLTGNYNTITEFLLKSFTPQEKLVLVVSWQKIMQTIIVYLKHGTPKEFLVLKLKQFIQTEVPTMSNYEDLFGDANPAVLFAKTQYESDLKAKEEDEARMLKQREDDEKLIMEQKKAETEQDLLNIEQANKKKADEDANKKLIDDANVQYRQQEIETIIDTKNAEFTNNYKKRLHEYIKPFKQMDTLLEEMKDIEKGKNEYEEYIQNVTDELNILQNNLKADMYRKIAKLFPLIGIVNTKTSKKSITSSILSKYPTLDYDFIEQLNTKISSQAKTDTNINNTIKEFQSKEQLNENINKLYDAYTSFLSIQKQIDASKQNLPSTDLELLNDVKGLANGITPSVKIDNSGILSQEDIELINNELTELVEELIDEVYNQLLNFMPDYRTLSINNKHIKGNNNGNDPDLYTTYDDDDDDDDDDDYNKKANTTINPLKISSKSKPPPPPPKQNTSKPPPPTTPKQNTSISPPPTTPKQNTSIPPPPTTPKPNTSIPPPPTTPRQNTTIPPPPVNTVVQPQPTNTSPLPSLNQNLLSQIQNAKLSKKEQPKKEQPKKEQPQPANNGFNTTLIDQIAQRRQNMNMDNDDDDDDDADNDWGSGLKKNNKKFIADKYYIDLPNLSRGILTLKYMKNSHTLPNFKPISISKKYQDVIYELIKSGNVHKNHEALSKFEKNHLIHLLDTCKIKHNLNDDDKFHENFQILVGEYQAGNDSVKKELKQYILHGLKLNKLTKHHAYDLLYELSL